MIQAMKNVNLSQKMVYHVIGKYNQNDSIKFETETIKSGLCDYSDAYVLVTRDIAVNAI